MNTVFLVDLNTKCYNVTHIFNQYIYGHMEKKNSDNSITARHNFKKCPSYSVVRRDAGQFHGTLNHLEIIESDNHMDTLKIHSFLKLKKESK